MLFFFSSLRKTLIESLLNNEKRNLLPDIWKTQIIGNLKFIFR